MKKIKYSVKNAIVAMRRLPSSHWTQFARRVLFTLVVDYRQFLPLKLISYRNIQEIWANAQETHESL